MKAVHDHDHDHAAGHNHGHGHGDQTTDERRIAWAFGIIFVFMFVEAAGGLIAGSLALVADAGHMLSDAAALGMSWAAIHIGSRPADTMRSYGYRRLEVLVAFVNGCMLFVIAGWIVYEAARRFTEPVPVVGGTMLVVAIVGLLANLAAFFILHGGTRDNLNMRSAWLHVLGDLLGFIGAIIAAGIILVTGWTPIDPILSIFVAVLILKSATEIVKSSAHILLEGTPPGVDTEALRSDLETSVPGIAEVHHVHVWSLTNQQVVVTLHARPTIGAPSEHLIPAINSRLKERFGVVHTTVQLDSAECADQDCC